MKITSLLALALLSSPLLHAQRYIAEGVNVDDITKSTLFYDSGKGYFLSNSANAERQGLNKLVTTDKVGTIGEVYGDLAGYLNEADRNTHTISYSKHVKPISYDKLSCWYQTAANTLEYWQHYYGVFANRSDIASGYTYNKDHLDELAGAMSLDLTVKFYDTFNGTTGGNASTTLAWYLAGKPSSNLAFDAGADQTGGFFAQHYKDEESYVVNDSYLYQASKGYGPSLEAVTARVIEAFGYEKQENSYVKVKEGQLAPLSFRKEVGDFGHIITGYGFELDEATGMLKALYVADSDDHKYGVSKIYIKMNGNRVEAFTDEACTIPWTYTTGGDTSSTPFALDFVDNINTSSSLNGLYTSYNKADNAQIWSGGSDTWGGTDATDDGGIATYNSGWVRYASNDVDASLNGHFYSKDESGRAVVFNDYVDKDASPTTERSISLAKNLAAPSVTIANDSIAYSFEGNDYSLTAESLVKEGSSSAAFRNTTLIVQDVQVREGSFEMDNTQLTGSMSVSSGAELHVTGTGNSISDTLTLHAGASLEFSNSSDTLTVNNLVIDKNFQSSGTTVGTLIVEGKLRVESTADVARMTRLSGIDLLSVTPVIEATLNANLDLRSADALTMSGALSLGGELMLSSTNKLTLDFAGTPLLDENNYLMLFTDIAGISIDGETADATTDYTQYLELSPETLASLGEDAALKYDEATGQLYVEAESVPEPSSATLSLLALAAFAARRRRR